MLPKLEEPTFACSVCDQQLGTRCEAAALIRHMLECLPGVPTEQQLETNAEARRVTVEYLRGTKSWLADIALELVGVHAKCAREERAKDQERRS